MKMQSGISARNNSTKLLYYQGFMDENLRLYDLDGFWFREKRCTLLGSPNGQPAEESAVTGDGDTWYLMKREVG